MACGRLKKKWEIEKKSQIFLAEALKSTPKIFSNENSQFDHLTN